MMCGEGFAHVIDMNYVCYACGTRVNMAGYRMLQNFKKLMNKYFLVVTCET